MMNRKSKPSEYRVALVTESLWQMGGSNRVLESFAKIYPQADIYALFGQNFNLSQILKKRNIHYSFLNRIPFIEKIYRYTFHLWPIAIEQFNFTNYDLVVSVSSSVAHGVITPLNCRHTVYLNTPMRYAWDLSFLYSDIVKFGFLRKVVKEIFLTVNRVWDVIASRRADFVIANSHFVAKRVLKYWDRQVDEIIYPPFRKYEGETVLKREEYFVAGAPFEPNKRGDFLLECAKKFNFNLKIVGSGSMKKKLQRKYRKYRNIEFLDWISEKEKWDLLSKAKGFVIAGIEDYGIFCAEAVSCGTPVIAFSGGGSLEILKEDVSGTFFENWDVEEFGEVLKQFNGTKWEYEKVRQSLENVNSVSSFKDKVQSVLVE